MCGNLFILDVGCGIEKSQSKRQRNNICLLIFTMPSNEIQYSEKYFDAICEYRHVILPSDLARFVPKSHLMTETEWRNLGVQQSPGWVHYMLHAPEPHVLLFRRLRTDIPSSQESSSSQRTITA